MLAVSRKVRVSSSIKKIEWNGTVYYLLRKYFSCTVHNKMHYTGCIHFRLYRDVDPAGPLPPPPLRPRVPRLEDPGGLGGERGGRPPGPGVGPDRGAGPWTHRPPSVLSSSSVHNDGEELEGVVGGLVGVTVEVVYIARGGGG